jgi:DNA-binding transcriptional regulator YiaG
MGRFSTPSPFSQGATSNYMALGFTAGTQSDGGPRWSRSAAKRELRRSGQTIYMSPGRLKEVLQILGLSRHDLAAAEGIKVGLVRDWLGGRRNVWPQVDRALEEAVQRTLLRSAA